MRKFIENCITLFYFLRDLKNQLINFSILSSGPSKYYYRNDWRKYSRMEGAEPKEVIDAIPILHDKTSIIYFDKHYFYQDIWAFKKILDSKCESHVDIGSNK